MEYKNEGGNIVQQKVGEYYKGITAFVGSLKLFN